MELHGLAKLHLYHDKTRTAVITGKSRYTRSILSIFLEAAGIKKSSMPHGSTLPTNFVSTIYWRAVHYLQSLKKPTTNWCAIVAVHPYHTGCHT
jgi:hypothetical protein